MCVAGVRVVEFGPYWAEMNGEEVLNNDNKNDHHDDMPATTTTTTLKQISSVDIRQGTLAAAPGDWALRLCFRLVLVLVCGLATSRRSFCGPDESSSWTSSSS